MQFMSWENGYPSEITRAKILSKFILYLLDHSSQNHHSINCDLNYDDGTLQKQKEIEDTINSVCILN